METAGTGIGCRDEDAAMGRHGDIRNGGQTLGRDMDVSSGEGTRRIKMGYRRMGAIMGHGCWMRGGH
jgi:hypothetical protein